MKGPMKLKDKTSTEMQSTHFTDPLMALYRAADRYWFSFTDLSY